QLSAFLRGKSSWSAIAGKVVTNSQGVTVPLINSVNCLSLIGAFRTGDVQFLWTRRGIQPYFPPINCLKSRYDIFVILYHQFDCLTNFLGEWVPGELRCRRQPGALNIVTIVNVATHADHRE